MSTSVEKAMDILKVISESSSSGITLSKISELTGINKSTCVHIINSLKKDDYVEKISYAKGYRLGPGIYYLTRYGRFYKELIKVCHSTMNWLSKNTGHTVLLAVMHENTKYVVDYITGERPLQKKKSNLFQGGVYDSATGRVLLSYLSWYRLKEFVEVNGLPEEKAWPQVKSFDDLWRELQIIRRQKVLHHAKIDGAFDNGLASALFDGNGNCIGAIGMALPITEQMMEEEVIKPISGLLNKAVNEINHKIATDYN